ncbi:hypothetical protein ACH5RR_029427 [Cinchona calisaya]|uniref:Uncharacterized protein n=1 Tax=Cinchona calisaya TaxID=153742 RepID=A0ABD2YTX3_9GENT
MTVHMMILFQSLDSLKFSYTLALLEPAPSCLYKTHSPRSPLLRVEPELVPKLFTMQSSKLARYKFQVLCYDSKSLYFKDGFDSAGGRWKDDTLTWVKIPCQLLLNADITWINTT